MVDNDDAAPGWDAIDAALAPLYPGIEPKHYGTLLKWRLGGPDPLDGISAYRRADHWHLVSYGMSELYAKESDDAEESGWGFEFTFRVARSATENDPPIWALNFLQNLARYVFASGNPFASGHHIDLNGPISDASPETAIRAAVFAEDPELGAIDTPHGRLRFLQVVGLALDEYAAIERWNAEGLLAALAPTLPLLVTDLDRTSLTDDPAVTAAVEDGTRREGSATGSLFVQEAGWRTDRSGWVRTKQTTTLTFGASAAARIGRVLHARLPFGRDLLVEAHDGGIGFRPGVEVSVREVGGGMLEVEVPPALLDELTEVLRPVTGSHHLASAPELAVEIVQSRIRDQEGNVVAEMG
ncbi:suppressor of fused domain protein [Micromonospora sp. SL1-18]|uniref:suppressor of fused domain protein n=1 Tax=Micromonospora sp. SL1-18 TaxID=3399128 RepID=UPI003A4DB510